MISDLLPGAGAGTRPARGVPDATVARLPRLPRGARPALRRPRRGRQQHGARRGGRREPVAAPQGPVAAWARTAPAASATTSPGCSARSPPTSAPPPSGRSSSSGSATWARRWPTTPASRRAGSASSRWSTRRPRWSGRRSRASSSPTSPSLEAVVRNTGAVIAVIATPADAAQAVTDRLVYQGVTSILNFASTALAVPEGVNVRKVDLGAGARHPGVPRAAQGRGDRLMSILAVSVSHRSTSMARLAALALDPATAGKLAQTLVGSEHIDEAVVLSTCNRTELWVSVSRFHGGLDDAVLALSDLAGEPVEDLRAMARVFFDEGAVAHAFAVASGLDSVVLGESQILGPGPRRARRVPGAGHRRHRPQRAVPAGHPRRQAGPDRDRRGRGRTLAGHRRVRPAGRGPGRPRRPPRAGRRRRAPWPGWPRGPPRRRGRTSPA